MEELKK